MKLIYLLSYFIFNTLYSVSQAPSIQWQKCYGGTMGDLAFNLSPTLDGGYIIIGQSESLDGDVTGNHGNTDCWVVKLTSNGSIVWQRSLGGSATDVGNCIIQTSDGGYIVAGYTKSNDGDVTFNHGNSDCWIIKLNSAGIILWQKCYGGTNEETARAIYETSDGGYIIAGTALSDDGDVSGNHGETDYWVFKITSIGDIEWQKCYGGTNDELPNSIRQTLDGGYIVCGKSLSNDGDVSGNHGMGDYWVVKLDTNGAISWQKCFGSSGDDGAASIQQSSDGGYIMVGSGSLNNGDITGSHGSNDFWVLKLNNTGTLTWQKAFGGSNNDQGLSLQQTSDGGFVIAGVSSSIDGDLTGYHGFEDYWVTKISESGVLEWQKSLGGTVADIARCIRQTSDGGFIIAGVSWSDNSGDVGTNHGNSDYWIVKLSPEPLPVSLDKFDATLKANCVLCSWQTQQEQNNNHFEPERSDDGLNFTAIGNVTAAGNSALQLNYSFIDKDVFLTGKKDLYYRLKMVDNDGSYDYSRTVHVKLKPGFYISVYPNPATDKLFINLTSPAADKAIMIITDYAGRNLYKQTLLIKQGNNSFPINIVGLDGGECILSVNGKSGYVLRFVKN